MPPDSGLSFGPTGRKELATARARAVVERAPARPTRAGDLARRIVTPEFVLCEAREHAENPGMARGDGERPGARRATARDLGGQHRVQAVTRLQAAITGGVPDPVEGGGAEH